MYDTLRNYKNLSRMFVKARNDVKLTQKGVAEKAGIHQAELSKLERGIGNPSINTLNLIAESLGQILEFKLIDKKEALFEHTGIRQIVIDEIRKIAHENELKKVILFGSRARGDQRDKSDIDLAISGGNKRNFSIDVEEKTSTLLFYDFVDLDSKVDATLGNNINREGIVLYEQI